MNGSDSKIRGLARLLLTHEARSGNSPDSGMPPAFRVSEKLRTPLSTLAGTSGFRALLSRALNLAIAQAPDLRNIQVTPDGSLEGLGKLPNGDCDDAGTLIITQLLGLLSSFIGEALTFRLVQDAWPDLPATDLSSSENQT